MEIFHIDEDIRKSETLPSSFYRERAWFERSISEIWEKCWIFIGDNTDQAPVGTLTPDVQTEYENLPGNYLHITPNELLHQNLWKHQD